MVWGQHHTDTHINRQTDKQIHTQEETRAHTHTHTHEGMRGGEIETAKEWQLEARRVTVGDGTERKRKRERE